MPVNNPPLANEVIIAGGGPTGLMLAGELALGGVDVGIIEQRMNQDIEGSRANEAARRRRHPEPATTPLRDSRLRSGNDNGSKRSGSDQTRSHVWSPVIVISALQRPG
jgi:flavin-dependent dehydrogenase